MADAHLGLIDDNWYVMSVKRRKYNMQSMLCTTGLVLSFLMGCGQPGQSNSPAESNQARDKENLQICCGGQTSEDSSRSSAVGVLSKNFGNIKQGEKIEQTFTLKNTGTEPAVLNPNKPPDLTYPCCVTLTLTGSTIEPGQSMDVKLLFDSQFRPGPIDIFANLPFEGGDVVAKLHWGGIVTKDLVVRPTGLKFETPGSMEFKVSGDELFKTVQVTAIKNEIPGVTVEEIARDEKKQEIIYQVNYSGKPKLEDIAPLYILHTHPKIEPFEVYIAPPGTDF